MLKASKKEFFCPKNELSDKNTYKIETNGPIDMKLS